MLIYMIFMDVMKMTIMQVINMTFMFDVFYVHKQNRAYVHVQYVFCNSFERLLWHFHTSNKQFTKIFVNCCLHMMKARIRVNQLGVPICTDD